MHPNKNAALIEAGVLLGPLAFDQCMKIAIRIMIGMGMPIIQSNRERMTFFLF